MGVLEGKVAAGASDPEILKRRDSTIITVELAQEYGITDIDGRTIPSLRATRGSPDGNPV